MFRREQEVVAPCRDQGRHLNLAEPVHHRPALEHLAVTKDEGFGPHLRRPQSYFLAIMPIQRLEWYEYALKNFLKVGK